MDSTSEPQNKKLKRNDDKCCSCDCFLRKVKVGRKIYTKEDAKMFYQNYDFFVQQNDTICKLCYTKLRLKKSQQSKNLSLVDTNQPSLSSTDSVSKSNISQDLQPNDDLDLSQALSTVSLEQYETEATSELSQPSQESRFIPSSESSSYYPTDESQTKEIEFITMPFERVICTKGYCFLCGQRINIIDVPIEARLQVFGKRRLFIPKRNRCCPKHLIKNRFYENQIPLMAAYSKESDIEAEEFKVFFDKLSDQLDARIHDEIGSYCISEERIKAFTGHSWDTVTMLESHLTSMRPSCNRNITQALVIFLFKLRSGNSNALIAAVFDVTERIVEKSIDSILKCFKEHVLPKNFGTAAHTRDFYLQQQAKAVGLMYDLEDTLFIICDGTYLRHEKSANNIYQRKSYSGQKKVPLCKPFTICTTNGYIIDLAGPFEGTINDAKILERVLQDKNSLMSILKKGDVFILDRGFRDVKKFLEDKGFKVFMPALKGKSKQLSTEESNASRFVTKLRWVVECVHGIIAQKYKLLHHQFRNQALPDAGTYCKVACYIYNLTGKRLNSDDGGLEKIIERMKSRKNVENYLAQIVLDNNYNQKSTPFQKISSADLLDFPELTLSELILFFTGTYQLLQSISYLGEMLEDENNLSISFIKENPDIVRFEVRSRHINSRTYKCYIHYVPNGQGIDAIKGYCCNCANGLRTIGSCSHVAALLYHLSNGRYLSDVIRPAEVLTNLFDMDNICPVINEDSDED